jgi:ATP-dependent Clp protease ATP-binding subunit ClpA
MAKVLALHVLGTQKNVEEKYKRWNMNDFGDQFSVTKLIGSAPGYIGSREKGALPKHCRQYPDAVLLFDEMEKAHPDVFKVFLPLLDEGMIQDNQNGQMYTMDKHKALLMMTSNAAADRVQQLLQAGVKPEDMKERIMPELKQRFVMPEFLGRIDYIVPFGPLTTEAKKEVLDRLLDRALANTRKRPDVDVRVEQGAKDFLLTKAGNLGARDLQGVVDKYFIPIVIDAEEREELKGSCMATVKQGPEGLLLDIEPVAGPARFVPLPLNLGTVELPSWCRLS